MLFIIDKLIIAFIYINIFANRVNVGILPIGKWIIGLSFFIYLIYFFKNNIGISKKTLVYIFISFLFIFILSGISIFLGNDLKDVMEFVTMLLILFTIPIFISLFKKYGVDRYIHHFLYASIILSIYIILIYISCGLMGMRELGYQINENPDLLTSVSYPRSGIRISVVTAGFLVIGILITHYFNIKNKYNVKYYLSLGVIIFSLYFNKTLSLWFAVICCICLFRLINIDKIGASKILKNVLFLALIFNLFLAFPEDIFIEKQISIYQKKGQMDQALAIFSESPLLGEGIGYVYTTSKVGDLSGLENRFLEVSYFMILSSTGLIGALFFSYIYLYYVFQFMLKRNKSLPIKLFFISHIAVLIAGVGNPYIWSGGFGLLFNCLLGAAMEIEAKNYKSLGN